MLPHDRKLYVLLLQRISKHFAGFYHSCSHPQRLAHKASQIQAVPMLPEFSRSALTDPAPFTLSAQCCLRSCTCISFFSCMRYRSLTRTRSHMLQGWHSHQSNSFIRLFLCKNTAFPHGPVCIIRPCLLRSELSLYLRGRFMDSEAVWRV